MSGPAGTDGHGSLPPSHLQSTSPLHKGEIRQIHYNTYRSTAVSDYHRSKKLALPHTSIICTTDKKKYSPSIASQESVTENKHDLLGQARHHLMINMTIVS
jgi:hypothetical protein